MEIRLSRHAKRRGKLYKISEGLVRKILEEKTLGDGQHEFVENIEGFKFPLKVVVSVRNDIITVITNYPLKKGWRK